MLWMATKEATNGQLSASESNALEYLLKAYKEMDDLIDKLISSGQDDSAVFQAPLMASGTVGRPAYIIPEDQLQSLIETNFTVPQISRLLGVSVSDVCPP